MKIILKILKFCVQFMVAIFIVICIDMWMDAKKEEFKESGVEQTKESILRDLNEFITGPPQRTVYPNYSYDVEYERVGEYMDWLYSNITSCLNMQQQTEVFDRYEYIADTYVFMLPLDDVATDENIEVAKTWYKTELDKLLNSDVMANCR